ncbi:unnamed protein product [Citrullus colocynthis]|uniref:Uncharacterized protein n=1 Tax=Citrullus colocynthis TaxID=252529 RepID=A0ABP0Z4P7_9ROSI
MLQHDLGFRGLIPLPQLLPSLSSNMLTILVLILQQRALVWSNWDFKTDKPDQCLVLSLFVERNSLNFNELSCRMELRFWEALFDEESKKPATLRCQSAEELRQQDRQAHCLAQRSFKPMYDSYMVVFFVSIQFFRCRNPCINTPDIPVYPSHLLNSIGLITNPIPPIFPL